MIKKLILSLVFTIGSFFLYAQQGWQIFNESNSGLPQNTIRCFAIDSSGLKWVGTDYGLASFDGTIWSVYQTSNSDLPDNSIRALYIDKLGNKWVGTLGGGLVRISGSTWTVFNSSNSGLPGNFVRAIAMDTSGVLWIGTSGGLTRFDGQLWQTWTTSNSDLISHHISALAIGENNEKYLGTINGGMVYFNDTTFTFYNLWNGSMVDNTVLDIEVDSGGYRWAAMPSGGLMIHYGGSSWSWYATVNSGIPSDAINCIYILPDQRVFLGSQDKGLIHLSQGSFSAYDTSNSDLPDNNVLCIEREDNFIWVGTMYEGLVRIEISDLSAIREQNESKPVKNFLFVNGEFSLTLSSSSPIIIYNLNGQTVFKGMLKPGENSVNTQLPPGMYIFRYYDGGEEMISKLFVVH